MLYGFRRWCLWFLVGFGFPKVSMYPYSIYLGLKGVSYIGTSGSKYILYGYMEPLGFRVRTEDRAVIVFGVEV